MDLRVKLSILLPTFLAAATFGLPCAQAWQSCELLPIWKTADFPHEDAFKFSQAFGISSNLDAVFAVGYSAPGYPTPSQRWTVRRSFDQGASWKTVHRFSDDWKVSVARAVATDGVNGAVFVSGYTVDSSNTFHWITQKSGDDGSTWRTVDDFTVSGIQQLEAQGVAVDARGRIFVVGFSEKGINETWYVRRSDDGGESWRTVDAFVGPLAAQANAVAVSRDGSVFVAGFTNPGSNYYSWTVRESADHGNTWSTVDTFAIPSGFSANAQAVATDSRGHISVSGYAADSTSTYHWITRSAREGAPASWTTVDDYTVSGNFYTVAQGNTFTMDGQLFVTGESGNGGSVGNYLTRQADSYRSTFYPSDAVNSEFSITGQGGFAAAIDPIGDVYTAGNTSTAQDGIHWMVRELNCR